LYSIDKKKNGEREKSYKSRKKKGTNRGDREKEFAHEKSGWKREIAGGKSPFSAAERVDPSFTCGGKN